ncbi:hypothetical protein N7532_011726 [Penicillium argentinense]|uniref:Zn(2)-C6 fungal-type domain-containing protein n=1 Tax=Penicillium argentinense TaxID=1131581 RepID=A0A9W9EIY0_9EURO|nr:uncharacterized protein N7532_011726 [Penicillium argentinense]KAJ5082683.1 hypothetical protein N7532_011726 [Penicillium argentinense]
MESYAPPAEASNKRPRSPTADHPPQSKVQKTQANHLQINYLARQYPDNLPLVSPDDSMPAIIHLVGEYDGVLQRHESIAGNLGACPLGPILIKRFERLFDGPPRVIKSHGKDGPTVTWLDVVEFAKSKPEQFNLEKSRNGVRVCQFYTKQCRVEISEEDFVLIASGMPQKMIPPQPIIEDEEKELGALEILEKNLQQIIQMADQVSARARQLSYRLKNRRTAIVSRRENDASLHNQSRAAGDTWRDSNGHGATNGNSQSSPSGFVAVNVNRPETELPEDNPLSSQFMFSHSNTENVTIINGTSIKGASPTTRAELMKKFFTTADRQARGYDDASGPITPHLPRPRPRASEPAEQSQHNPSATPVAIPSTPSSLLPPPKTTPQEKDDGGPFKLEMVARMEELQRGERVTPPCDRCRRLNMDCLKNLTACMGCTKKHAKCSWRDVKEEELRATNWYPAAPREVREIRENRETREMREHREPREPREGFEDDRFPSMPPHGLTSPPKYPVSAERERERRPEPYLDQQYFHNRRESAPGAPHIAPGSGTSLGVPPPGNSPRRAMSETEGSCRTQQHQLPPQHGHSRHADDEDPDANQRLMQAILDTVDHHARVAAAVQEKERGAGAGAGLERPAERSVERPAENGTAHPHRDNAYNDQDADRERERWMVQA